jgi:hypothetical protein
MFPFNPETILAAALQNPVILRALENQLKPYLDYLKRFVEAAESIERKQDEILALLKGASHDRRDQGNGYGGQPDFFLNIQAPGE